MIEFNNQVIVASSVESVYAALNDPAILAKCIPRCNSVSKISASHLEATITLKVGPMKASFVGDLEISNLDPPNRYTLHFSSQESSAGNALGQAKMMLTKESDLETLIRYEVNASVDGKIAKLGPRLITSTAHSITKQFFKNLNSHFSELS